MLDIHKKHMYAHTPTHTHTQGGPKKVSHYHESSLNYIKTSHCG